MTASLPAGDLRLLDLLSMSEVTLRLRLAPESVRRLAAEGVLVRVPFGGHVRFTRASVAAYERSRAEFTCTRCRVREAGSHDCQDRACTCCYGEPEPSGDGA